MNLLELWFGRSADRDTEVAGPRPRVIGPSPDRVLGPPPRFAWDEKRWRRVQDGQAAHYLGEYRVSQPGRNRCQAFKGRIVEDAGGIKAYVADLPPSMKHHSKGPCFQLVQAPWFRVHWHRAPQTIDDTLLYVERLLDECLNGARGWW